MTTSSIIELSLFSQMGSENLLSELQKLGVHDCIEASCDFLDSDESEAEEILARFEAGSMNLPVLVYSYEERFIEELVQKLQALFPEGLDIQTRTIRDELWKEAWEPGFRFLESERFIIGAADLLPSNPQKIPLRLQSGTVFGSGQHATTQALVQLMEQIPAEGNFLDVGTGTGVLLFVADRLGYRDLTGTDIEDHAIAIARENAEANQIPCKLHAQSLPPENQQWDTIACNILPPTLTRLFPDLAQRLSPRGRLLLAGFHEANAKEVEQALLNLSFQIKKEVKERGWIAWLAERV